MSDEAFYQRWLHGCLFSFQLHCQAERGSHMSDLIKTVLCFSAPSSWHIQMFSSLVRLAGSSSPLISSFHCLSPSMLLLKATSQLLLSSMTMWAGTSARLWCIRNSVFQGPLAGAVCVSTLSWKNYFKRRQTCWRSKTQPDDLLSRDVSSKGKKRITMNTFLVRGFNTAEMKKTHW